MEQHPLRKFRNKHGIGIDEMARRAGTSKASISRIENGSQWPSGGLLSRLIRATNGEVTADDFLTDRGRAA